MKKVYDVVWQFILVIAMFISAILGNISLTIAFGVMAILNMDIEGR
ncbi:hypothetical protein I5677_12180 [Mobilitalea sibirica]|uniref:Uncharacterized protein n=1 Tax=Mobilitalea sibirica TaxID=1462919 RepID=A0A8J7HC02_9FIRM|nr:hypothetical protein [Mobilitalea sibirica]MBH1941651.1 hypothetical protein [Mobilitalea sibirica]